MNRPACLTVFCLALSACQQDDMSDLQRQLDDLRLQQVKVPAPLPALKAPEKLTIDRKPGRDPFSAKGGNAQTVAADGELAAYELDTLKMVGTITLGKVKWGLILTQDGKLFRVHHGDAIGTHAGVIDAINDHQIEIKEEVMDFNNLPRERKSLLLLADKISKPP